MIDVQYDVWPQDTGEFFSSAVIPEPGYPAKQDWAKLIKKVYGYKTYPIKILNGNGLAGFAALTHIKHPIFGSYLTSAPYSSYGGVWFRDKDSADILSQEIKRLTQNLNANYAVLRFRGRPSAELDGWNQSPIYNTYRISLHNQNDTELGQYSPNHRNHIRKSLKKGFDIQIGSTELIRDTYIGISRTMRQLGSPYHSQNYLTEMCSNLKGSVDLAVLTYGKNIVGAGVFIRHADEVINLHANILREYRPLYAGEFFYWSMIQYYKKAGQKIFDLGRSLEGSGNETFKLKWEPEVTPLSYWYYLPDGRQLPDLNQKSPKFQAAIAVWKRLPQFLVDWIGPHIINGIA